MQRKKQSCTWRKITRGTLYPFPNKRNRRVKHKEIIEATPEELGRFIHEFELVDGDYSPEGQIDPVEKAINDMEDSKVLTKDTYEVIHINAGWFNVISSAGKVMNDKKLRKEDADLLKSSLEEQQPSE